MHLRRRRDGLSLALRQRLGPRLRLRLRLGSVLGLGPLGGWAGAVAHFIIVLELVKPLSRVTPPWLVGWTLHVD
jgi:hypothetical protein